MIIPIGGANCQNEIYGCTDTTAFNYNPLATINDNSCLCLPANFCDDFESYQNGDFIAQTSPNWNTWGELQSGTTAPFSDDANVSSMLSSSGSNSLYFDGGGTGGPQDIVLPFSFAPYTIGYFNFSAKFYVTPATGAYFNFQAENTPGVTWSLDVKMDLGTIVLENSGSGINYFTASYPEGVWFELKISSRLNS